MYQLRSGHWDKFSMAQLVINWPIVLGKVAELLDRHGLSLSEIELRRQACEGVGIDTARRRRGVRQGGALAGVALGVFELLFRRKP